MYEDIEVRLDKGAEGAAAEGLIDESELPSVKKGSETALEVAAEAHEVETIKKGKKGRKGKKGENEGQTGDSEDKAKANKTGK